MSEHSKSNSVRALALVWLIWRDGPLTLPTGEQVRHACPIAFAFTEPHARELYEAEQELDPTGARGELHMGQADVWSDEIEQAGQVRTIFNAGGPSVVEGLIEDFDEDQREPARHALRVAQWRRLLLHELACGGGVVSGSAALPTLRWGKVSEGPDYWCPACALDKLGELAHFVGQPGVLRELRGGGRYYRRIVERGEQLSGTRAEVLVAANAGQIPPGGSGLILATLQRTCTPIRVEVFSQPHEDLTLSALRFGTMHIAGAQADDHPATPIAWSVPECGVGTAIGLVLVNHGTETAHVSVRVYA